MSSKKFPKAQTAALLVILTVSAISFSKGMDIADLYIDDWFRQKELEKEF